MFDAEDRRLNEETDARTNQKTPPLALPSNDYAGIIALRKRWAEMPMIPKVVLDRSLGIDNSWPGFDLRTLLVGEESGGRFTYHDLILAPGAGLPAHHQTGSDTYWYMLEGEIEATVGARTETARRDAFGYIPADTTQAIQNRSSQPAQLFLWYSPAGPERAFAAAHKLAQETPGAPAEAFRQALAPLGFNFHQAGERLENDARTNAAMPRLEARVDTSSDFADLRQAWTRRPPVPKLVHDRREVVNIPMVGQETRVLVSGDEDSGLGVVFYYGLDPGYRAPPHHQPGEEEIFLVVEGTLELIAGNVTVNVPRGGFGFVPRYGTHGFYNATDGFTASVTMNSPAGHERGFEMIVREAESERFPDLVVAHGWRLHEEYTPPAPAEA